MKRPEEVSNYYEESVPPFKDAKAILERCIEGSYSNRFTRHSLDLATFYIVHHHRKKLSRLAEKHGWSISFDPSVYWLIIRPYQGMGFHDYALFVFLLGGLVIVLAKIFGVV